MVVGHAREATSVLRPMWIYFLSATPVTSCVPWDKCEEAGHGCKCLDVAESPAVRQATAGEHYQKSWGYDGLQPLPLLAQVRSHSQEYGIKRQRRQHTRVCIQKWNTNIVPQFCLFVFFSQSWIYQHNESVLRGIKTKRRSGNIKSVSQGQI